MVVAGFDRPRNRALAGFTAWLLVGCFMAGSGALVMAQQSQQRPEPAPKAGEANVMEVRIEGATTPLAKLPKLATRAGQSFDPKTVEDDVRALSRTQKFLDITPKYQRLPSGIVVMFQVVERPTIKYVKYVGREKINERVLQKNGELKVGDALDPHEVEDTRRRLELYYHEHGFPRATITTVEGTQPGDRGVVYLINEGTKQRIWWTQFEGNTIADDARLRTQIQSKPGIFWFFGGNVDQKKIEEDVDKLTAYYRALGFFQAKVGRDLDYDEDKDWLTVTYVINEGPRYKIRNVSIIGNEKFTTPEVQKDLELKGGEFFDQAKLNRDLNGIRDIYGGQGYIFSDVQADTRFLEEPGMVDLVYDIAEGNRYRVGRINIQIAGDNPHTRQRTVQNRLSLRPGDIVDTRLIRADEARLKRAGIFTNKPQEGQVPKIAIVPPPGMEDRDRSSIARTPRSGSKAGGNNNSTSPGGSGVVPSSYRGQSPDSGKIPRTPLQRDRPQEPIHEIDLIVTGVDDQAATRPVQQPELSKAQPNQQSSALHSLQNPTQSRPATWPEQQPERSAIWPELRSSPSGSVESSAPHRHIARKPIVEDRAPNTSVAWPSKRSDRITVRAQSPESQSGNFSNGAQFGAPTTANAQPVETAPRYYDPKLSPVQYPGAPNAVTPRYAQYQPGTSQAQSPTPNSSYPPPGGYTSNGNGSPVFGAPPIPNVQNGTVAGQPQFLGPNGQPGGIVNEPIAPGGPGVGYQVFPEPVVPEQYVDLDGMVTEAQTGRLMFGVGVNSNAGLIGNVVIEEQNFDITRWPTSFEDFRNGSAWRGAGQRFRIEAAPGTEVSRYSASFTEPYLGDSPISLTTSGSYFQRFQRDWREERLSGRLGFGYQIPFRPDLSLTSALRVEQVTISEPRVPTPPELQEVVGVNDIFGVKVGFAQDTRDSPFLPTEGYLVQADVEQVFGSFTYTRGTVEARRFHTVRQRADGSGRHVLSYGGEFGLTGSDTPIYDNFFAGGYSTLRGFEYRGASPRTQDVVVGGRLQLLGTVEYMFPITADDMLRGVVFTDFGTVERELEISAKNFRVAPGFGMLVTVPALGPAPISFTFAFPVAQADGDEDQVFAFYVGFSK